MTALAPTRRWRAGVGPPGAFARFRAALLAVVPHEYVRIVPRSSAFYGIVIAMFFDGSTRFHARYGEHEAQIVIATGGVLQGEAVSRSSRSGRSCTGG